MDFLAEVPIFVGPIKEFPKGSKSVKVTYLPNNASSGVKLRNSAGDILHWLLVIDKKPRLVWLWCVYIGNVGLP